jgi:hypothetical protein
MVRAAKFGDIPRLKELMVDLYQRSSYARFTLDLDHFKALCFEAIRSGAMCLFVADGKNGGPVEGFLLGTTARLYQVGKELCATDMLFYVADGADRRAAGRLMDAFIAWAKANPKVVEITMGATDAVADYRRTAKLYARKGLRQEGVIYKMELVR